MMCRCCGSGGVMCRGCGSGGGVVVEDVGDNVQVLW